VVREQITHVCCDENGVKRSNFLINFKILFIQGNDLLFKNKNLYYNLDNTRAIQINISKFVHQISGKELPPPMDEEQLNSASKPSKSHYLKRNLT